LIIYSFDTGISTGVAKYDSIKEYFSLYTLNQDQLNDLLYSNLFDPDVIILERIPAISEFGLGYIWKEVEHVAHQKGVLFKVIAPSTWKPFARARKWKCYSKIQHEYDAYALLRYFYLIEYGIDLGDK
jgi:hypothetical protein